MEYVSAFCHLKVIVRTKGDTGIYETSSNEMSHDRMMNNNNSCNFPERRSEVFAEQRFDLFSFFFTD